MTKPLLSVVAPGTKKPPPAKPMSITTAAAEGTYKDLLIASRTRLASAVEDPKCPPRDLAALMRRLHEVGKEIEAIEAIELEEAGGAAATPDEEWTAI